jgi:5-methylcytosine-specific restriction endonuclease McrA
VCRKAAAIARKERETPEQRQERLRKAAEYRSHPDRKVRQLQLTKEWQQRNPERVREVGRAADQRRATAKTEYNKQWRKRNSEVVAAHSRNRRALVKSCEGSHTADDIQWLLKTQRYKCSVCRKDIKRKYHVDHIKPLAKGGANDKTNLQVLCPTCNNQKHAADPIDFMQRKGFLL